MNPFAKHEIPALGQSDAGRDLDECDSRRCNQNFGLERWICIMRRDIPITDVLFDVDGVLVYPAPRFRDDLARVHQILPETTAPFFRKRFQACVTGKAHLHEELAEFLTECGWTTGVEAFIHRWMRDDDSPDAEVLGLVAELRGRGIRCHVASVQERRRAGYLRSNMGFADQFDSTQFSCDVGAAKPDQSFFEQIEQRLQRTPEQLLLVDDSESCVVAARERGWSTFHYAGPTDHEPLREMLAALFT